MRVLSGLAAALMLMGATPAFAQATFTFTGAAGVQPGETLLASFDGNASTYGGITGSYSVLTGNVPGVGADPAVLPIGDPYLAILGNQTATYSFAGGLTQLGLDYGSVDPYNLFTLSFLTGPTQSFTGTNIFVGANGNQTSSLTNGRLTFSAIGSNFITGLTLQSSQNSLELDNIGVISAVPEPATWGMMLIGFAAIGASMRRRRATGGSLQAA